MLLSEKFDNDNDNDNDNDSGGHLKVVGYADSSERLNSSFTSHTTFLL